MGKVIWIFVVAEFLSSSCSSQNRIFKNEYTVLSYNVENLFDTTNDPTNNDEEFLPLSAKQWTNDRYHKKLEDIAKVIIGVNPWDAPEIIGLMEVENRAVLEDLIHTDGLKKYSYGIIHDESPDERGIDVAFIYRKDAFTVTSYESLPVVLQDNRHFKTRDILHVIGKVRNNTIHIFVNHWPSRTGGEEKTEPKRILAASVLKQKVDQLMANNPKANIVIMGDLNDEPDNISIWHTLGAKTPETGAKLVNLMIPEDKNGEGSYFYRGEWNMLDNLIVSRNMIDGKSLMIYNKKGQIYRSEWMIFTNRNGARTPDRTYVSDKYTGGVSDHFPVYFKMKVK